jgi:pimeloyl-ACP methyl ester carboxylesterase
MVKKLLILSALASCFCQEIFTEYLIESQDTIDVFSYQIPQGYDDGTAHPLLVAFHQWGGNENSTYSTTFDEEANARGWIFMSPYGGSGNNYNHQGAQEMVRKEILWLVDHYAVDLDRIYMVGGSMGGAAGMIYANNHLNPDQPMVAAAASGSGILDCERRAIEMDGNNSMIEWFGGNWDEVPFEYHRNSAIYFADSTQSMHYNLQYTPIYLDFGVSETHRIHAEEMYETLLGYNENMWIDTDPTGSHGFSVMDEQHVCDWLSEFTLLSDPPSVHLNLDEPGRGYFFEAVNQINITDFISIDGYKTDNGLIINEYENSDSLALHILNSSLSDYLLEVNININKLGITGSAMLNENTQIDSIYVTTIDGVELSYTVEDNIIWLENYGLPPYELPMYGNFILNIEMSVSSDGDINEDGSCNIQDIILIISHIIGSAFLSDDQAALADMNDDGAIDIMDIIMVINVIIEG